MDTLLGLGQLAALILAWEGIKRIAIAGHEWWTQRKARRLGINWTGKDAPIWDAKYPERLDTEQIMDDLEVPEFLRRRQAE